MSKIEILAPVGSEEMLRAAVFSGADAVYLGFAGFNARTGAGNFTADSLKEAVRFCHVRGVKVHVALNTTVYGGELAGEYIKELLGEAGGELLEIQGVAGTSAARDRGEGFHKAVDGVANYTVVDSQIGNWDKAQGMTIMENALQAHPNIKAVFAHNDTMAMGAMEAAYAAGREDIIIIGFDADDDAVQAVKDGKLAATVAQQPDLMGGRGVELAHDYLNGMTLNAAEAVEVALIKTGD